MFVKRTWCVKGECEKQPCPLRCYVAKEGRCVRFREDIWPKWASKSTREHSGKAWQLFTQNKFSWDCTPEASAAAQNMVRGTQIQIGSEG